MDFTLSEEQVLLQDSVSRLFSRSYSFEQRLENIQMPEGWSRAAWTQFAELGLLALPFDEEFGGLGYGPVEMMLVMESMGRSLVVEPYLSTVVLAGGAIQLTGNADQKAYWLNRIASGDAVMGFANAERYSRYSLHDVATTAQRDGGGYLIEGEKVLVAHCDSADAFVVVARVSGERHAREGLGLFLVDAKATGVSLKSYRTHDGVRAGDLLLEQVRVGADAVLAVGDDTILTLERLQDAAIAATAAEAVGAMQASLDMTVEYLQTRKQFGVAIGSFQALQHRAAEMLIDLEQARSMAMFAALMIADKDPVERARALSAVKVQINKSGRLVTQQAIQLHGGIGVTEEYAIGHYFRRLSILESQFGDTDYHLARFSNTGGFIDGQIGNL